MDHTTSAHIALLSIFCLLLCGGCNSKRNAVRNTDTATRIEQKRTQNDSSRIEHSVQIDLGKKTEEKEDTYFRTVDYDSLGNIRRISEQWRNLGRVELSLHKGSSSYLSLNGSTIVDTVNHVFRLKETETVSDKKDSRPIQGIEWLWIGLGIATLILLIYLLRKLPFRGFRGK